MAKVKLTVKAVENFKAASGQRINYFDATLPGFALRVSGPTARQPAGSRSWILFYRIGGVQKMLTIEPGYPALGLADARQAARDALQLVAKGQDPATTKAATAAAVERAQRDTIEHVSAEFIKRHLEARGRAASYVDDVQRTFNQVVIPAWRGRPVGTITRRDVIELLDGLVDAGKPIAANRTLAAVRAMFNWAMRRGIVDASPAAMVEKPGEETRRDRILSDGELRQVWSAAGDLAYPWGPYFRLLLATAQRRAEVATMRWADLDLDAGSWTLPAELTKPGRTNLVPLSATALAIIRDCPIAGAHVFTTRTDAPISGFSKAKKALDAEAADVAAAVGEDAPGPWALHDLRRTAATVMGKLGTSRFVLGRVLNHSDGSVTGIYDRHEYLAEKRAALDAWGAYLLRLAEPPGGNAVALHG